MKEKLSAKEISEYYKARLSDNKKELEKIEKVPSLEYFNDPEIEGYPWWKEWNKKLTELEQENLMYGEKYQETKSEEDYQKYSESDKQLQSLKRDIDEDVNKYKKLYQEKIIDTLSETVIDFRETVTYNIGEIDKEIKRLNDRKDLLIKDREKLRESYKGDDYDKFFYEKINKLFTRINELTKERESLLKLEVELDIEEFTKIIEKNKKTKDKPADGDNGKDKPVDDKNGKDKPADGKTGKDKPADGKIGKDKPADGKTGKDKPADGKNSEDKSADGKTGKDKPADGKNGKNKPIDGKTGKDKPVNDENGKDKSAEEKTDDDRDVYSNSYGKNLDEYKMMLEMYNQDLETLYNLQKQYENDEIDYTEYEKHADYMVERYRFMMTEYGKVKGQYESEKNKINKGVNPEKLDLENKLEDIKLKIKELWQQGVHENTPEAEKFYKLLQEKEKIEEQIKGREEDPLKDITNEDLKNETEKLKKQLKASADRMKEYKDVGSFDLEAGEHATYNEIVRKLSELEKEAEKKDLINLEAPEKPEQPMMILEKEKENGDGEGPEPEPDYSAIEEEYAYRKQDMVDKFMGNREKAKEYEERLNRFKDHIVEKEFEYVDENGRTCKGTYKTIEVYEEYEKDTFFLQLEEYKDRLEDMTKFDAGDKSVYKDKKIGDRIITAQEQRDKDSEYIRTYNYAYNSHVHTQNNLMTLGNYGDKVPYSEFQKKQPVRNVLRATGNLLKFARNWTIAPVSRFVGKRIVAPIHRAIYKPEQSNPNPYKGRRTHRYEQRKNYFAEQGKGYFRSSFAAMFNYKEGNIGTLAARGGEIYQSIENKYIQIAKKQARTQNITNRLENTKQHIAKVKEQLELTDNENEKESLNKKLSELIQQQTDLQKERYSILSDRVDQTVQTDSIENKTHDRANKRNITRAVTTVKALAIGAVKYYGPKLHRYILDKNQTQIVTWKKGPDTVVNTKQYVSGNYQDVTVGDFMQEKATTTYAANGITPHNTSVTPKMARGFAVKDGTPGDGYSSFIDGNGMTSNEIARIADKQVPTHLLDASGNLSSSAKLIDLAKEVGIDIQSKADMEKFINNLELCLSESGTGIGHRSGWVGNLLGKLKTPLTDGHWKTVTTTVPGKMQKIITYADNITLKKIFTMIEKGTDAVIVADVIDQAYENIRKTEGQGKAFKANRNYAFDDRGKTKGPVGFEYDRKGRNRNQAASFVPTYSPEVVTVLGAKSLDELKEKLANVNREELTKDEIIAIRAKKQELENELERERRTPKGEKVKDLNDKEAQGPENDEH